MAESRREKLQRQLQLDEAAVRNNTLFAATRKQDPNDQRLTLIIGIGGSGVDSVYTSYRLMREKLNPDFNNYVKFIAIDAQKSKLGYAREVGINHINISTPGATERITTYVNRPEFYKSWMEKNFSENFDDAGANRIRMAGRAKLYDQSQDGGNTNDSCIRELISDVSQSFQRNLPLDIILVSGVAGGTGGGTLIDIAAMARAVCQEHYKVRLYGYMFLPDTVQQFFTDAMIKRQVYANGYAFLKELESYMCLIHNKERKESFNVPGNPLEPLITLDYTTALFDDAILISGKYQESKNLISECLANMVSKMNVNTFSHQEFYSNKGAVREAKLCYNSATNGGLLKAGFHCEDSHIYSGIGVSTASIPEEIVIPNIVGNTCERLYSKEEQKHFRRKEDPPTRQEAKEALRHFFNWNEGTVFDEKSLWNLVRNQTISRCVLTDNKGTITAADIIGGKTKGYEDGFLMEQKKTKASAEMKVWFQKQYDNFVEQAKEIMYNDGPRMIKFLYEGMGPRNKDDVPENYEDISLKRMLQEVDAQLRRESTAAVSRPSESIVKAGVVGGLSNVMKGNVDRWKRTMKQYVEKEIQKAAYGVLYGDNGQFAVELKNKIEAFVEKCEEFAEAVEMLGDFYRGQGRALDAEDYHVFHSAGDNGINVNLCDDNDVFLWVKDKVREKINSVKMEDLRNTLVQDFQANQSQWVEGATGEARSRFDGILSRHCKVGAKAPIDEDVFTLDASAYFDKKLDGVPDQEINSRAIELVRPIVQRLLDKGRPSLNTREVCETNCFILLPQALSMGKNSGILQNAFKAALPARNKQILISHTATKIICYQTSVANSLYELNDITDWEAAYEGGYGKYIHLNQGERGPYVEEEAPAADEKERIIFGRNLSWYHYPALALGLKHVENAGSKEGEYLRKVFNPVFEYALKEKIIFRAGSDQQGYFYKMCVIPPAWSDLRVDGYSERENGRLLRGEHLFAYWSRLPGNRQQGDVEIIKDILLDEAGFFSDPFLKQGAMNAQVTEQKFETEVLEYTKAILRKDTCLFRQLRETLYRYWEIGKRMDESDAISGMDQDIEEFVKYLQIGMIYQSGDSWYIREQGGNGVELCSFGLRQTMLFEGKDKAVYEAMGLRLPIVLDHFMNCAMYRERQEDMKALYKEIISEQDTDEALHKVMAGYCENLKEDIAAHKKLMDSLGGNQENRERAVRNMLPEGRKEQDITIYKLRKLYEGLGKACVKF